MANTRQQFTGVIAIAKANVYFDGKVVSHTILFPDGGKKTLGLICTGSVHFKTKAAERTDLVAGNCRAKLDGQGARQDYGVGQALEVPSNSGFDIEVEQGICEYVCSFLS